MFDDDAAATSVAHFIITIITTTFLCDGVWIKIEDDRMFMQLKLHVSKEKSRRC